MRFEAFVIGVSARVCLLQICEGVAIGFVNSHHVSKADEVVSDSV
jgi:hypothetical protein